MKDMLPLWRHRGGVTSRTYILGTTDYLNENTPKQKIRLLSEMGHKRGQLQSCRPAASGKHQEILGLNP